MSTALQLSLSVDTGLSRYSVETIARALISVANDRDGFTSDDVHDALPQATKDSLALYENALGAIVKAAAKKGIIAPTPQFVRTRRPEGRGRMIRVWRRAA